jgi:glycosyltransferase involved in cell wall biosynthesis
VIRGLALNPYEMEVYGSLASEFDLLAVGRRNPVHEVHRVPVPTVLLHSLGESHALAAAYRRFSRTIPLRDHDRLLGMRRVVAGRDILHAAETALTVSEQAAEIAARSSARLVLTCWETIPFRYDDDPLLAARKIKVKQMTACYLAVTERARAALITEGVPASKIRVVSAAIDCARFRPRPAPPSVRSGWGVPADALVTLYVGRLIQEKGVVELVQAFAKVADRRGHLVLVGSGNQQLRLRAAAHALGVGDRVHVLPGISHGAMPDAYLAADVVAAPSLPTPYWEEQFGMVLVEAMACGRPLLTTSSGAIAEVVGDAAEIVPAYDVATLARALGGLLNDRERRAALGAAGRHRAERRYDLPVVAAGLAEAYHQVLGA